MEKKLNLCVYVCVCVCVCVIASAHHVQMVTLSARILLPWFILPDFSRFNSAGMNKYPLVSIAPGHQVWMSTLRKWLPVSTGVNEHPVWLQLSCSPDINEHPHWFQLLQFTRLEVLVHQVWAPVHHVWMSTLPASTASVPGVNEYPPCFHCPSLPGVNEYPLVWMSTFPASTAPVWVLLSGFHCLSLPGMNEYPP